jgi:demethylmenaquinone methyltransferase/2-methoxy-6-polyprenyl-1,4-benzoquinol methylase
MERCNSPVCQAAAWHLPFVAGSFDRLYSSYVLDLIPYRRLPKVLAEFNRVLVHGGRLVIIALTEGTTPASRALVAAWKAVYAIAPVACGGCRPLQLASLVEDAGFSSVSRQVVIQLGVPSEIISATR